MTSSGSVREYDADEGWGVIDGPDVPGGCWVHFSAVAVDGYRSLEPGQAVTFQAETADQDGYAFRAVTVWVGGAGVSGTGVSAAGVSAAGVSTAGVSTAGVSTAGVSTAGVSTAGVSAGGMGMPEVGTPGVRSGELPDRPRIGGDPAPYESVLTLTFDPDQP